jgi:hypothetical protein
MAKYLSNYLNKLLLIILVADKYKSNYLSNFETDI